MQSKILMIVTSCARMGEGGKPTGVWAEELFVPYYAFVDAGAQVEIASPAGGPVPFDPASLKPAGQNPSAVERYLADAALQRQVQDTARVADLLGTEFDALFLPGGHGTMWDLPEDDAVRHTVEHHFAAGHIVAAVCHGPAGLLSARREDGRSILEGRRVNAFTNAEEEAAGLAGTVPFLLESRIRELGGRFESGPQWQPYGVRDGNLITGQNPSSSEAVAKAVLEALKG